MPRRYCYEPCTREQAQVSAEDVDVDAYWVHVATGEIYRYIELAPEQLPIGAQYVRPVNGSPIEELLSTLAVANCEGTNPAPLTGRAK